MATLDELRDRFLAREAPREVLDGDVWPDLAPVLDPDTNEVICPSCTSGITLIGKRTDEDGFEWAQWSCNRCATRGEAKLKAGTTGPTGAIRKPGPRTSTPALNGVKEKHEEARFQRALERTKPVAPVKPVKPVKP